MRLEVVSYTPETLSHTTPILFLHGAWHGAWCWEDYFLPYFAEQGFSAHAMSLRAHGKSEGRKTLRWLSMDDYVTDLVEVVHSLPQTPVIVGHSLGGFILHKYLEHYTAPAAILMAPAPARGGVRFTYRALRSMPGALLKTTVTFSPYHLVNSLERSQTLFFSSGMPRAEVEKHFQRMQDDSFRAYLDFLMLALPDVRAIRQQAVPMLILGGADDHIFPPREIEGVGRLYDAEVAVLPNMAHDMMLEPNWQSAADKIIGWLQTHSVP